MPEPIVNKITAERSSAPIILVVGQTGAGKSHFCNKVLGENVKTVKESARLSSCTTKPQLVSAEVDGKEFLLIDTPGFNDTFRDLKRSDANILGEIALALTLQSQLGVPLRGVLYLYDISVKRMTGDTLRQFELIKTICGRHNFGNVLLVTTHWPERIEDQKKQGCAIRVGDLRKDFWKEMINEGSSMCQFDDQHETAKAIIRRLAGKGDISLALQDEMKSGKTLKQTSAFSFIVGARLRDERQLKVSTVKELALDVDSDDEFAQSVAIRKRAEDQLNDDIIDQVRSAIQEQDEEAKKLKRAINVKDIIRWLIGVSGLAMGVVQLALQT